MQHIKVIAVGKAGGFCADGVAEYAKRLGPLCRFEVCEVAEEKINERALSGKVVEAALEREGERLLAAVPKGAAVVALCVEGRQMTSEQFADYLDGATHDANKCVAFVIGSSHGLGNRVKQAADLKLGLSAMTLPHQLARLVLCEQVYRAMMIRHGGRYHK